MKKQTIQFAWLFPLLLLSGCASMHQAKNTEVQMYQQQGRTVPPLKMPSGMTSQGVKPYYPAPATNPKQIPTVSTIPPGSNIQKPQQSAQSIQASQSNITQSSATSAADQQLVLAMSLDQAWQKVGDALQGAGYRILDQDSDMHAYFILNTTATAGAITTQTPIERIQLTSQGKNTTVTVRDQHNQPADSNIARTVLMALNKKLR